MGKLNDFLSSVVCKSDSIASSESSMLDSVGFGSTGGGFGAVVAGAGNNGRIGVAGWLVALLVDTPICKSVDATVCGGATVVSLSVETSFLLVSSLFVFIGSNVGVDIEILSNSLSKSIFDFLANGAGVVPAILQGKQMK